MRAIIIGGASCVWDDVDALEDLWKHTGEKWDGLIVAVNDIACHWPRRRSDWTIIPPDFRIDIWATLHPEKLFDWMQLREANGLPGGYVTYAHKREPYHSIRGRQFIQRELPLKDACLSSGLFGWFAARDAGATEAYLCGVPMTATPHFEGSREHRAGKPWKSADEFWSAWTRAREEGALHGLYSMSGRTRELLGPPPFATLETAASEFQTE